MRPLRIRQLAHEALTGRKPHVAVPVLAERLADVSVGINGSGEVVLLDERGLRSLQREPFENFVAVPALNYLKAQVRFHVGTYPAGMSGTVPSISLAGGWLGTGSDTEQYQPGRTFGALFLSDSTATESSGTETYMPGNILGSAMQGYTTASIGNRGTMVTGSSTRSPSTHSHRYEWGTTQANGTIGSVGWAADANSTRHMFPTHNGTLMFPVLASASQWYLMFPEHPPLNDYSASSPSSIKTHATRQSDGLTLTSAANTTTVLQLSTSPFTRVNTSTIPTTTSAYGTANTAINDMCIDSTNLWYVAYSTPWAIRKEALGSLGTVTAGPYTRPWAGSNSGYIAANSTHLFVTEQANSLIGTANRTIYKLDQSDGSTTTSWTHDISARGGLTTNASIHSLVWDYTNSLLGVIDASGTGVPSSSNGATCTRYKATWYNSSGTFVYVSGLNGIAAMGGASTAETTQSTYPRGSSEYQGMLYLNRYDSSFGYIANLFQTANLGTRTKLGSAVTKTSSNSLRVVYDFTFS